MPGQQIVLEQQVRRVPNMFEIDFGSIRNIKQSMRPVRKV